MVHVRYFAAAAEAAGTASEALDAATLGALCTALVDAHGSGLGQVLERCSLLVDGVNTADADTVLDETTVVDVLPPFAGG